MGKSSLCEYRGAYALLHGVCCHNVHIAFMYKVTLHRTMFRKLWKDAQETGGQGHTYAHKHANCCYICILDTVKKFQGSYLIPILELLIIANIALHAKIYGVG